MPLHRDATTVITRYLYDALVRATSYLKRRAPIALWAFYMFTSWSTRRWLFYTYTLALRV